MSDEKVTNLPSQKELETEIGDYLAKKYGGKVKLVSAGMFSQAEVDERQRAGNLKEESKKFQFDLKPEELISYLDEYVVKQDRSKAVLATKICTHFNRIRREQEKGRCNRRPGMIKGNVLLIGPTGVGKTYLLKLIAGYIGVPFVKGDATKFSETGYVGGDVEDLVRDLVRQADDDIERAECGIIYVDEIDKIAGSRNRIGADVSRTGVQRALLKPMEETEVDLKVPHDPISMIEAMEHYRTTGKRAKRVVNTRNILFIMSGSFPDLEEIIKKRLNSNSIGFARQVKSKNETSRFLEQVKAEDLLEFGFESEFVGRLPVVSCLQVLAEEDFLEILLNPTSSVVVGKKQDFMAYGIYLLFEEGALMDVAHRAVRERTGARGLFSVMERILLPFERTLPSTDISHFVLTRAMVADPEGGLKRLLSVPDGRREQEELYRDLELREYSGLISFIKRKHSSYLLSRDVVPTEARLAMMATCCQRENLDPRHVCGEFADYVEHIRQCAEMTSDECEIPVVFNDEAIDRLLDIEPLNLDTLNDKCETALSSLEYGLRLLSQKTDIDKVLVTAQGVDDPKKFINDIISEYFVT